MEQSKFYQIKNVTECEYTLVGCDGSVITRPIQEVDKIASAFTIQDAKDGDVLTFKNNIGGIIICKSPTDYDTGSYCRLMDYNFINKEESGWDSRLLVPAPKEGRDLLFQKMKKVGYEWDAEKKELKKFSINDIAQTTEVQQKPTAWSEEDIEMFGSILSTLGICMNNPTIPKEVRDIHKKEYDWFNELYNREIPQPQQEWSEEDFGILNGIINYIACSDSPEGFEKWID